MSASRDKMINALRKIVVPTLRDMQFKGTFPHFKRPRESQMDLLAFQFSRWGGSFVIEVAWCDAKGWLKHTGELVEPDEVRVNHINPKQRLRLGSNPPRQADYWFRFEPESDGIYADVALEALTLVRSQGEDFWQRHKPAMVTDPNWPRE